MKKPDKDERMTFASPTFGTRLERAAVTEPLPEAKPPKSKFRIWLKRGVFTLVALIIAGVLIFGWEFYSAASKLTNQHNPFALFTTILPRTPVETNGRVNILLTGYSVGDPHHQGAALTDSIMIVSINPKTKQGNLISIPRDLWVHIPGNGYSKINAAYEDGQAENFNQPGYFSGGLGLLQKVISSDFGVHFNYYALINYAAVRDGVNAVGGINITINSPDPRGIYDPYTHLKLPNGTVHLDGQQALDLSRTRGDGPGSYGIPNADFTRTQYQQEMLVALKRKAGKISSIFNPLTVLRLVNAVGNNVQTNLKIGEMESLYGDVKGINSSNIKTVTLNDYNGKDLLSNYYVEGQDALIPAAGFNDYSAIKNAVNNILYGS